MTDPETPNSAATVPARRPDGRWVDGRQRLGYHDCRLPKETVDPGQVWECGTCLRRWTVTWADDQRWGTFVGEPRLAAWFRRRARRIRSRDPVLHQQLFGLGRGLTCSHWWRRRDYVGSQDHQHVYLCRQCKERPQEGT